MCRGGSRAVPCARLERCHDHPYTDLSQTFFFFWELHEDLRFATSRTGHRAGRRAAGLSFVNESFVRESQVPLRDTPFGNFRAPRRHFPRMVIFLRPRQNCLRGRCGIKFDDAARTRVLPGGTARARSPAADAATKWRRYPCVPCAIVSNLRSASVLDGKLLKIVLDKR